MPITTLLFLTASAALAQSATCDAPPLVVTRARMLGSARADREVVISDGRVVTAGVAGKLKRPPNARIIDARGDTLLPGLIDAHAHMYDLGGPSPLEMYSAPRENSFPITARQLLRSGVTTARVHLFDLVNGPALKRNATSDCFPSPRLQIGGPGITGGQPEMSGAFFGGYRDVDDARAKLNAAKTAGADWIALHGLSRYPPGELEQISDEAHRLGLRVMAEGDPASRAERALAFGADSIEYLDRSVEGGIRPRWWSA